ncbi:MAG: SDR family oxidoreductase [Myxococcales bacterium]|nr:SDR family oxidoreductase [Myxococcales bacterium]MCB9753644.1 SDR family oxidoreductase [Myxococcales bacterium]
MSQEKQKSVLITGCSTGFGRLTAQALATAGHRVFATMRAPGGKNAEHAASLTSWAEREGLALEVLALDVTSEASIAAAVARVEESAGGVDVVVNNAGVAGLGLTESYTTGQLRQLFEVNVFGVQSVCRAVLPGMRARGSGLLVFISSGLGRIVMPCMGVYVASKFALEALAETYAYELKPVGVDVTIIQPGTYPTGIGANMASWAPAEPERAGGYGAASELPAQLQQGIMSVLATDNPPDPTDVSSAILDVVARDAGARPRRVVVDKLTGGAVEALNQAAATVQGQVFSAMGLGALLPD